MYSIAIEPAPGANWSVVVSDGGKAIRTYDAANRSMAQMLADKVTSGEIDPTVPKPKKALAKKTTRSDKTKSKLEDFK